MENKQKRITLKTIHEMLDGMSVELAEKVHLLFMAFSRFPPSPLSQEWLHLSLYSLSSGEGKIENFENPSFSKFWYRSRSLFGDLHSSSRFIDMLCDAQAQYGDYSELDECPMWGMWEKEGGE